MELNIDQTENDNWNQRILNELNNVQEKVNYNNFLGNIKLSNKYEPNDIENPIKAVTLELKHPTYVYENSINKQMPLLQDDTNTPVRLCEFNYDCSDPIYKNIANLLKLTFDNLGDEKKIIINSTLPTKNFILNSLYHISIHRLYYGIQKLKPIIPKMNQASTLTLNKNEEDSIIDLTILSISRFIGGVDYFFLPENAKDINSIKSIPYIITEETNLLVNRNICTGSYLFESLSSQIITKAFKILKNDD